MLVRSGSPTTASGRVLATQFTVVEMLETLYDAWEDGPRDPRSPTSAASCTTSATHSPLTGLRLRRSTPAATAAPCPGRHAGPFVRSGELRGAEDQVRAAGPRFVCTRLSDSLALLLCQRDLLLRSSPPEYKNQHYNLYGDSIAWATFEKGHHTCGDCCGTKDERTHDEWMDRDIDGWLDGWMANALILASRIPLRDNVKTSPSGVRRKKRESVERDESEHREPQWIDEEKGDTRR